MTPRENGWDELVRPAVERAWRRIKPDDDPVMDDDAELAIYTTAAALRALHDRLAAARGEPGLDVERLMEAMNEAFTYEDRDNSQPTLPFVDDGEAFWTPFAAQVAAEYNRLATPTTPEPDQ